MKTEILKNLGLTDEQIQSVQAEAGKDITALKTQIANLQEDLKVKDGVIEAKSNKISEFEKIDIDEIKRVAREEGLNEGTKEVDTFRRNNALKSQIKGVKDVDYVISKLDMNKLKFEKNEQGEYSVSGIEEQLKDIKEKHSFIFEDEQQDDSKKEIHLDLGGTHNQPPKDNELADLRSAFGLKNK